jgi:hypothetical protein
LDLATFIAVSFVAFAAAALIAVGFLAFVAAFIAFIGVFLLAVVEGPRPLGVGLAAFLLGPTLPAWSNNMASSMSSALAGSSKTDRGVSKQDGV